MDISKYKSKGLSSNEVAERLKKLGKNEISKQEGKNPFQMLYDEFKSPLIIILILASIVSFIISYASEERDFLEPLFIITIVIVSAILGFLQEYKAEKTIEALKKISTPKIRVIRDGKIREVLTSDIVPQDIVLIKEGDIIPADCRVLESYNLKVDESVITGESEDLYKKENDELYAKTSVKEGEAVAIVVKTGMNTFIGKVAKKMQEIESSTTQFEIEINDLSKKIAYLVIGISITIFIVGLAKYDIITSMLTSISLAVAAVPEGLIAVLTLSLAIGAKIMMKKNALVRKLNVIETLGAVDVICTDKTGTITKDEMEVKGIIIDGRILEENKVKIKNNNVKNLILCSIICNNADVVKNENGVEKIIGDGTEISLIQFAERFGIKKEAVSKEYKRINEIPFSSERKMMSVIVEHQGEKILFSKGAPEIIIKNCEYNSDGSKITGKNKEEIIKQNNNIAKKGFRTLAFAYRKISESGDENSENNLTFLGIEFMMDPPKEGVKEAVQMCKKAGIRIIMITGDNPLTAASVAKMVGIESSGVITGKELDLMDDENLIKEFRKGVNILARVSPFHKLRVLEVLKYNYRVAMTGDGVNDALSLKKADVGIAMGKKGTEVAKEASDIILLDDNFASIVSAIKEGRRIFNNIRKFINYLLTSNFAEVFVVFASMFIFTLEKPILLPIQILWINLLTDGLPAISLGIDPAPKGIMNHPPRQRFEGIINSFVKWTIIAIGIKKSFVLLLVFTIIFAFQGEESARSALFMGFVLYELVRIAVIRNQESLGWASNKWVLVSIIISIVMQLIAFYTPLNKIFGIKPLGLFEWLILVCGIIIGYYLAIKLSKYIIKLSKKEGDFISGIEKIFQRV